ncbi:MAG TPA: DUF3576 domain-containing protein [Thalassobaculum sp.]
MTRWIALTAALAGLAMLAAGCADTPTEYSYPRSGPGNKPTYETQEKLTGPGGIDLFSLGGDQPAAAATGGGGVAVNAFLWRASLDTLSFMPLSSADPFGGVIITDWYVPPQSRGERFKITVYILDRALRSDGIRANVFRQDRTATGQWIDAPVEPTLGKDLEDAILTRARQIRIQQTAAK